MSKKIVKLSQPINLIFTGLAYMLGAGMARYLGADLRWPVFWLDLLSVLSLQVSALLFAAYFQPLLTPVDPEETPRQREQGRVRLLQAAYAALTLTGGIIVTLVFLRDMNVSTGVLFVWSLLLLVAYAVPPFRLSGKGYGELALGIYIATLVPAISFISQMGSYHRLLPLTAFPLTLLALACFLALDFSTFAADEKFGRHTLLTRLTWQRAVPVHQVLVLAGFLLFAAAPFFGISWGLIWPVFLALPFAALQMVWIQRISNGGSPFWKFFNILVPSCLGLAVYLLALSFWLH